nr:MAG: hypothetical protein [Bacteriophage sp.]
MRNNHENNIIFARFATEIINNKYDIENTYIVAEINENWSNLTITFYINLHECHITIPINYQTQTIDKLVEDISERINRRILRSYLK